MCSYVRLFCVVALLAAEPWASALEIKHAEPRRCHYGLGTNETGDCVVGPAVECPAERPYCSTVATAPNFSQSLSCAAASTTPCSLSLKMDKAFQITCICAGHLCNAPYSPQLRNELLNFVTKLSNNTHSELIAAFLNSSVFANVTKAKLYKALTVRDFVGAESKPTESTTVVAFKRTGELLPRAAALKQAATVPPDDDEDDGEGSGMFDEHKSQAPASPAAPSSFLPEQNRAPVHHHILSFVTILLHVSLMFKNYY